MRLVSQRQRSPSFYRSLPSFTQQWETIFSILEANPSIDHRVWDDLMLNAKGVRIKSTGTRGMTAEQAVRFAIPAFNLQTLARHLLA
jgi:hypothetical protein